MSEDQWEGLSQEDLEVMQLPLIRHSYEKILELIEWAETEKDRIEYANRSLGQKGATGEVLKLSSYLTRLEHEKTRLEWEKFNAEQEKEHEESQPNEHYEEAYEILNYGEYGGSMPSEYDLLRVQAQATLAIAFELQELRRELRDRGTRA